MFLEGKNALVTGATGAIGGAICEELLKNGIKNLAALDIHSDLPEDIKEMTKKYPSASIKYFKVDVTSHEQLKKCYADFTGDVGVLDIVVNCAGIFNENLYETVINVNLGGVIGSTILAIDHMRVDTGRGKGGIILNISSIAGLSSYSRMPIYCATKHGVISFTRAVSHGREELGIKFLILCPSATESKLYDCVFASEYLFMSKNEEQLSVIRDSQHVQSATEVGKAAVEIIKSGQNGETWKIQDGEMSKVTLPEIPF